MSINLSPALINDCQQRALGHVLSEWGSLTYEQVIESLEADSDTYPTHPDIVVWQPFEDQWSKFLAEEIENLFASFKAIAESALASSEAN
ncbi:hypothetical protein UFOVP45_114 [uncultured Caudovirales phage]|uniref:Uncharacterized protein n=1 Tax=uncultured Caudovirales phage TaxID=2100421 RepID=A0A6J5KSL2_9CAUD|nr:hypothetical protein UFOVP45_114 [uncultured Caudovirales phage]